MKILGVETSCDETAAAVVEDGTKVLGGSISSQEELHRRYGGVVPEAAARRHVETIIPTIDIALHQAQTNLRQIDVLAVSTTPGLLVALLVGIETARTLSFALGKPLVTINDLESHIFACFLERGLKVEREIGWPLLALVASGGTTALLKFDKGFGNFEIVGATLDDAAGEAFDKVSRLLGLGYPGGPEIESLALSGNSNAFSLPRPMLDQENFDFSFSGLKTAVLRITKDPLFDRERVADMAASFQAAVVETLVGKTLKAARSLGAKSLALGGGVAANTLLRTTLTKRSFLPLYLPSKKYCVDNAAMVAGCAYHYARRKVFTPWEEARPFEYRDLKGKVCKY